MNTINFPRPNTDKTVVLHGFAKPPGHNNVLADRLNQFGRKRVVIPELETYHSRQDEQGHDRSFITVPSLDDHVEKAHEAFAELGDATLRIVTHSHGGVVLSRYVQKYGMPKNTQELVILNALIEWDKEGLQDFFDRGEPTEEEQAIAGPGAKASKFITPRIILSHGYASEVFGPEFDPAVEIGLLLGAAEDSGVARFGVMAQEDTMGGWTPESLARHRDSIGEHGISLYQLQGDGGLSDHHSTGREGRIAATTLGIIQQSVILKHMGDVLPLAA